MLSQSLKCASIVFCALLVSACSRGLDRPLITSQGFDAYKSSLAEAIKDMDQKEMQAFDWAVSDLSIEALNTHYPNQSPRKVIRGEASKVLNEFPMQIAELERQVASWTVAMAEMNKVAAENPRFSIKSDFFGSKPQVFARVRNGSQFGFSSLRWRLELFLDAAEKPAAASEEFDWYKEDGGLKPGAVMDREFSIGFVSGDPQWSTLEIQNAKQRTVRMTLVPHGAKDFGERSLVGSSPVDKIDQLKQAIETAGSLKNI